MVTIDSPKSSTNAAGENSQNAGSSLTPPTDSPPQYEAAPSPSQLEAPAQPQPAPRSMLHEFLRALLVLVSAPFIITGAILTGVGHILSTIGQFIMDFTGNREEEHSVPPNS